MKRRAFTLIEMMIAIVIFSLVVVLLYKSYDSLKRSNTKQAQINQKMQRLWQIKKLLYLDFTLALQSDVSVLSQEKNEDVVILQTSNSIHNRTNPYVAYVIKDETLYRIESLRKLTYPFDADVTGDVDEIGKVKRFRIYKALKKERENIVQYYLIDIKFQTGETILYKVAAFNQTRSEDH